MTMLMMDQEEKVVDDDEEEEQRQWLFELENSNFLYYKKLNIRFSLLFFCVCFFFFMLLSFVCFGRRIVKEFHFQYTYI